MAPARHRSSRRIPADCLVIGILGLATLGACSTGVEPTEAAVQLEVEGCDTLIPRVASGVAIGPGVIATVAHTLLDDGVLSVRSVDVLTADDRRHAAVLSYLDTDRDLALLAIDHLGPFLPLAGTDNNDDEAKKVTVLLGSGAVDAQVVERATATIDGTGARAALRLDVGVEPGDSGAAVIGPDQEVVGIVFAAVRRAPGATATGSWAIAASEIDRALDRVQDSQENGEGQAGERIAWACP